MSDPSRGRRLASAWLAYGGAAALVVALMAVVSAAVVRLDRAERIARRDADRESAIRLALWRMDSWLEPFLARESARPFFEYLSYYPHERAYNRILNRIQPGEVLTPSPLLTFDAAEILVHFQVDAEGNVTSPQVPEGNLRDLAEATLLPEGRVDAKAQALAHVGPALGDLALVEARLGAGLARQRALLDAPDITSNELQSRAELWVRQQEQAQAYQSVPAEAPDVHVGAFAPVWLGPSAGDPRLVFVREVQLAGDRRLQGFALDWNALAKVLLAQAADLLPGAALEPIADGAPANTDVARVLALLPAVLVPPPAPAVSGAPSAETVGLLATSWVLLIVALAATGLTLRASRADAERRARFASAVTHEMRTPLTTFRMYADMLAEGMVPPEKQAQYLTTMRDESNRLAALVENVLAYARLERGRAELALTNIDVDGLFDRVRSDLERRLAAADMQLCVEPAAELTAVADASAVEQILGNLVDNACKHAAQGTVTLGATRNGQGIRITVTDEGPGIAADDARTIFTPFSRAATTGTNTPGIGLGLAIARGLARRMGGDLDVEPRSGGAQLVLTLASEACGRGAFLRGKES